MLFGCLGVAGGLGLGVAFCWVCLLVLFVVECDMAFVAVCGFGLVRLWVVGRLLHFVFSAFWLFVV